MVRSQKESAEAVWRERLARFDRNGLTVKAFCLQEGIADSAFYQWRKRLRKDRRQSPKGDSRRGNKQTETDGPFVPVSVPSAGYTEVEFPNGVRLRVPATNAEALRVALTTGNEVCREVD